MAYWDSTKQQTFFMAPHRNKENQGWLDIDCGCCNGLTWYYGEECAACMGTGILSVSIKSGTLAIYPGGPLAGSIPMAKVKEYLLRERENNDLRKAKKRGTESP